MRMRMPLFEEAWRVVDIPVFKERGPTAYTRFGDWFPRLLSVFLLIVLAFSAARQYAAGQKKRLS